MNKRSIGMFGTRHRKMGIYTAQSRQSALIYFFSRRNWDSPPPQPQASVPLSLWFRGEGHTRWRERGWESLNSDEGTYTVVLDMCVLCVILNREQPRFESPKSYTAQKEEPKDDTKLRDIELQMANCKWRPFSLCFRCVVYHVPAQ
jgi:hypothetical protein